MKTRALEGGGETSEEARVTAWLDTLSAPGQTPELWGTGTGTAPRKPHWVGVEGVRRIILGSMCQVT